MNGCVLLLDDDHLLRSAVRNYLASNGLEVLEAARLDEALRLARVGCPEAIITDYYTDSRTTEPLIQWGLAHGVPVMIFSGSTEGRPANIEPARLCGVRLKTRTSLSELAACAARLISYYRHPEKGMHAKCLTCSFRQCGHTAAKSHPLSPPASPSPPSSRELPAA